MKSRSERSPTIFAHWPGSIDTTGSAPYGIANVQSFFRHQVILKHEEKHHTVTTLLAHVKWFEEHPRRHHSVVVCGTLFRAMSNANYISVSRILGRCTTLKTRYQYYGQDCVTIAVPSIHTAIS